MAYKDMCLLAVHQILYEVALFVQDQFVFFNPPQNFKQSVFSLKIYEESACNLKGGTNDESKFSSIEQTGFQQED